MTLDTAPELLEPSVFQNAGIDRDALDEDAVKVVGRLRRKGHEAFLVGGCVRDLLLHRRPKDFDVATSARPRQIKSLFRNCRIIGRRFKLAHLYFENKVIEVSTFRRRPEPEEEEDDGDLLIKNDNAFGTAREDATRRDFTINGLFLDPRTFEIHDFVDGIRDIGSHTVRTIGDPLTRIKEDPVRILRAIKFASRLGLEIEPATWQAMCDASGDLSKSAPPRVLEEILRLLRTGRCVVSFQLLRDCGALEVLIPEVSNYLRSESRERREGFWRVLEAIDSLTRQIIETGRDEYGHRCTEVTTPILISGVLFPLFAKQRAGDDSREDGLARGREIDLGRFAEEFFSPILRRLNLSRAESGRLKRICVAQRRFVKHKSPKSGKGRGFRVGNFIRQDYFTDALTLYRLRCLAQDAEWSEYDSWLERYREVVRPPEDKTEASAVSEDSSATTRGRAKKPARSSRKKTDKSAKAKSKARAKNATKAKPSVKEDETAQDEGGAAKRKGRRKAKTTAKKRSRSKKNRVHELPPLPEIELDPTEVPTYGSVLGDTGAAEKIELESSKSKKARRKQAKDDTPYVPPPPPEDKTDDEEPDTFGDW